MWLAAPEWLATSTSFDQARLLRSADGGPAAMSADFRDLLIPGKEAA
jgi:hypothetical protein